MFASKRGWLCALSFSMLCVAGAPQLFAHGNHRKKATLKSEYAKKINVYRYDGDDGSCTAAHGSNHLSLNKNESTPIRCHSKGKDRCKIRVKHAEKNSRGKYKVLIRCKSVKGNCKITSSGTLSCS